MRGKGGGREDVRDSVKDMRTLALGLGVPARKDSLEFLRNETTIVDFYGGPGDTLCGDGVGQSGEGELVSEEGISSVSEEPEALGDAIAVPKSQGDQVIPWGMEDVDELGQCFESSGDSGTGTIGESGSEGKCSRRFPVGNRLGRTGAVPPLENGVGGFDGRDFERYLPDWVKADVRIAWSIGNKREGDRRDID